MQSCERALNTNPRGGDVAFRFLVDVTGPQGDVLLL